MINDFIYKGMWKMYNDLKEMIIILLHIMHEIGMGKESKKNKR